MKKVFIFIFAILISLTSLAQNSSKISAGLLKELGERTSSSQKFRVMIIMAEEYDQVQMTRQIQYLDKAERRAFVIDELQKFSKASQGDLLQVLEEGVEHGVVTNLTPFWISNSIACSMTRDMINSISSRSDIALIESDEIRNMLPPHEKASQVKDNTRGIAWNVERVNADDVWSYNGSTGYKGNGVVVAIIDTGVNYNHNDIKNNMWTNSQGYHGYDFVNGDNDPMDDYGHGSHCAGTVAGTGASGTKTGMAPEAKIMALKVLDSEGSGSNADIQNAMQYAINNGADIVSMSLGAAGDSGNAAEREIFINMLNAGIIAAVAAGNEGENYSNANPDYDGHYYSVPRNVGSPGNCPPPWHNPDQTLSGGASAVVCVGASNRNDRKSTFSSMGPVTWSNVTGYKDYAYTSGSSTNIGLIRPDIAVPGSDITSLDYSGNSGYTEMCGTSMATPGCAGIMALMLSAKPSLTPAEIDEILETTAIPSEYQTCKNNLTGAGRADALAAIDAIFTTATKPTNLNVITCGGDVTLSWTASTAPAGYCIYRDNIQIASDITETTYTDHDAGTGKHIYYVRANDGNNRQSVHSNCVVCSIEPYATVPQNLIGTLNNTSANLSWQASTVSNTLQETTLNYVTTKYTAYGGSSAGTHIGGVRYLTEELGQYKGMSIDQISFYVSVNNITHTICLYRGTTYGNTTGAPVVTKTFTPSSTGWQTITLDTPYELSDVTQDLWVTIAVTTTGSGYPISVGKYDGPSSECFYMAGNTSPNNLVWSHLPDFGDNYNYALCIKTHFTRTTAYTPTYSIYRNDNPLISDLSATHYTDASPILGLNEYYVTAEVNYNESCASESVEVITSGGIEIHASCEPLAGGSIEGARPYLEGSTATLTAHPNIGYAFVNWTEGNTIVSTETTYSFTVTGERTLVAHFETIPAIDITYACSNFGSISSPSQAYPNQTVSLIATPDNGYHLSGWTVFKTDDINTIIPVTDSQFTMPSYPVTVVAHFSDESDLEITVGSGTGTSNGNYLPTNVWYKYNLSQQIFTPQEIGGAGVITSISFYYNSSNDAGTRDLTIYMSHTNASAFSGTSDWKNVSSSDQVFKGGVSFNSSGWKTITLTQPFAYDGSNNLLLTVDDNTGSYSVSSSTYFYTYATGTNRGIYYYNDSNHSDPLTSPITATGTSINNSQIKVNKTTKNGSSIAVTPCNLSGFSTTEGIEASEAQSVTIISKGLSTNITVTAPSHYEVSSTLHGTYGDEILLMPNNGEVMCSVFVRLKAGLTSGDYNESLTLSSGQSNNSVTLNGHVNLGTHYTISYTSVQNGSINGPVSAYAGQLVTLTATPESGYGLETWVVYKTGDENTMVDVTFNQFVMPGYDVTVSAVFTDRPEYNINIACGITYGSISANLATATEGTLVTLTATPGQGYQLTTWMISKLSDPSVTIAVSNNSFVMPGYDVMVAGIFSSLNSGPARYEKVTENLTDWSGEYLIVCESQNKAFNGGLSSLDVTGNNIAVTISNGRIESNSTTDAATFTIAPYNKYYSILSKSGYYIGRSSGSNGLNTNSSSAFTNEIEYDNGECIILSNNLYLMYNKTSGQNRYRYFTSHNQEPIQLYKKMSAGNPDDCIITSTCSLEGFTYAEGNGPSVGQEIMVIASHLGESITITAPTHYEVSSSLNGTYSSNITINEQSSSSTTLSNGVYTCPVYVRLKADLNHGGYNGETLSLSSGTTLQNITLSGQVTPPVQYTITVSAEPVEGGTVTGGGNYSQGHNVTVEAVANTGYVFDSWRENDLTVATTSSYSFNATADRALTAYFEALTLRNINYTSVENGTISGPSTSYPGETVTLTVEADDDYILGSWNVFKTGDPNVSIEVTNHQFVMPDYDVTVSAVFLYNPEFDINLSCTLNGSISTSLSSAAVGTVITLTATPAQGYQLSRWIVSKNDDPSETISVSGNSFIMPAYHVLVTGLFTTQSSGPVQYEKVTQNLSDWSGEYLIVYEGGNKAFDGSLDNLDVTDNFKTVNISNGLIQSSSTVDAATFTIDTIPSTSSYSIQSKSGYFIGSNGDSNSLVADQGIAYANTIEYTSDDGISIVTAAGAHLRYNNTSNQNRFRYFKPSTYYLQQAIQLYKKSGSNAVEAGLAVSTCSLEGFTYAEGNGPSAAQHLTCWGTSISDLVTVTAPTGYEVGSSATGSFASSMELSALSGELTTTIYIRLKTGLVEGTYDGILAISTGTTVQQVELSGSVTEVTVAPWTPVGNDYEVAMTLIGVIQINGVEQSRTTLEVGAFCGNECRGTQRALLAPTGKYLVPMTIVGEEGESISFKLYDHQAQEELDLLSPTSLEITENGYGTISAPHILNFLTPFTFIGSPDNNEWGDDGNWSNGAMPGEDAYVIIDGHCELTSDIEVAKLVVTESSVLVITEGQVLTAGEIITTDPTQLIIEDGGQLYCNSEGVKASFHKTIEKTTDDTDGWYTIATPVSTPTILNLTANTYDIFEYDEDADQEEWKNFRVSNFTFVPGHGYLYANSAATGEDDTDLVMMGVLTPSNTPIEVALSYGAQYEGIRGFNLIGNPYPHNISMNEVKINGESITEFYRISNGNQLERFTSGMILPGESFFIKATAQNQTVIIGD